MNSTQQLTSQLEATRSNSGWQTPSLFLTLADQVFEIQTNSAILLIELQRYFKNVVTTSQTPDCRLQAIESDEFDLVGQDWVDWPRPLNKAGRKDALLESPLGRLVYKVKTGMLLWQHQETPLCIGPVEAHPNQVINFILTQSLNQHLRQGWLLGHCAALEIQGKGLAIAGLSGGGKSTLMLHLMEMGEHFISNDRLVFQNQNSQVVMRGIPKHPRINPGTIVHNPRLHGLISAQQKQDYLAMPQETLRQIEHKFDADVNEIYGSNCYKSETQLSALIVLNWQGNSDKTTSLRQTTLKESPELLAAIIKSPGPFYADASGKFLALEGALEENLATAPYFQKLGDIPCWELTGKIDFHQASQLVLKQLDKA